MVGITRAIFRWSRGSAPPSLSAVAKEDMMPLSFVNESSYFEKRRALEDV